jgi:hypothetical protein
LTAAFTVREVALPAGFAAVRAAGLRVAGLTAAFTVREVALPAGFAAVRVAGLRVAGLATAAFFAAGLTAGAAFRALRAAGAVRFVVVVAVFTVFVLAVVVAAAPIPVWAGLAAMVVGGVNLAVEAGARRGPYIAVTAPPE